MILDETSITLSRELVNDLWFIRESGLLPEEITKSWNAFLEYLANQTLDKLNLKEKLQALIDKPSIKEDGQGQRSTLQYTNISYKNQEKQLDNSNYKEIKLND